MFQLSLKCTILLVYIVPQFLVIKMEHIDVNQYLCPQIMILQGGHISYNEYYFFSVHVMLRENIGICLTLVYLKNVFVGVLVISNSYHFAGNNMFLNNEKFLPLWILAKNPLFLEKFSKMTNVKKDFGKYQLKRFHSIRLAFLEFFCITKILVQITLLENFF